MIVQKTDPSNQPTAEVGDDRSLRRTVIPTPRRDGMFSGWGVRF